MLPSHLMLFHVNVQAVLLGKGGITLLTFVGLFTAVQPLVDLEVVLDREPLTAVRAHPGALPRMGPQVPTQPLAAVEKLWADVALEDLVLDVHVLLVLFQDALKYKRLPAQLAHVGPRPRLVAVLPTHVDPEVELVIRGVGAVVADKLLQLHADTVRLDVHLEGGVVGEGGPAGVAQVLPLPLEEHYRLPVAQPHAVRAQRLAGEATIRVHTHVVGHLQATAEAAVALEALVVSALVVLHTHTYHTHTHTYTRAPVYQEITYARSKKWSGVFLRL